MVKERTVSFRIVIMEVIAKRRPDATIGIQNDLPTFRYLMFFKVLQPSTLKRVAIKAKAMFEMMITQSIFCFTKYFLLRFKILI